MTDRLLEGLRFDGTGAEPFYCVRGHDGPIPEGFERLPWAVIATEIQSILLDPWARRDLFALVSTIGEEPDDIEHRYSHSHDLLFEHVRDRLEQSFASGDLIALQRAGDGALGTQPQSQPAQPPKKPQAPASLLPWNVTLSFVSHIAPGAETKVPAIQWTVTDPSVRITSAKLEVFRTKTPADPAPIFTRTLSTDQLATGTHSMAWQGQLGHAPSDFPDGFASVEFSPYTIVLTATDGSTKKAPSTTFAVDAVEFKLQLGTRDMLSTTQDLALFDKAFGKTPALPAASTTQRLQLVSNLFTDHQANEESHESSASFAQYESLWGNGPRIPLVAAVRFRDSQGNKVLAPLAWGRRRVLWDWNDPTQDVSTLDPEPQAFVARKLAFQQQNTLPVGENCHVALGGKRSSDGNPPVFVSDEAVPGNVITPSTRVWNAFSTPQKGGTLSGMTGVMFQPSRQAGDAYQITARFDQTAEFDVTGSVTAAFQAKTCVFEIWREISLARFLVKHPDIPMGFSLSDVQKHYDPAFIQIVPDPSIVGGPDGIIREVPDKALFDATFLGLMKAYEEPVWHAAGAGHLSAANLPLVRDHAFDFSISSQFDAGTFALAIRPFEEFRASLIAAFGVTIVTDELRDRTARGSEIVGSGAITHRGQYSDQAEEWVLDIVLGADKTFVSPKQGLTLFQFGGLHSRTEIIFPATPTHELSTTKFVYTLGVSSTDQTRARGVCYIFGRPNDLREAEALHQVVAHEIGHQLFLPHVELDESGDPLAHDNRDPRCLMGHNIAVPNHFCGYCLLRMRGWDHTKFPPQPPPPPPPNLPNV